VGSIPGIGQPGGLIERAILKQDLSIQAVEKIRDVGSYSSGGGDGEVEI